MRSILFEPVLSFREHRYDVLDVVLAGLVDSTWTELEADAAAGLAALEELRARGNGPLPEDVHEAGRSFRYDRGLLSGGDLERWLAARGLSRSDWRGFLRRTLARERLRPAAFADAAPVLRADAYCSGALKRSALRLISGAAAESALAGTEVDEAVTARLVGAARATTASGLEVVDDAELDRRARAVARLENGRERLVAAVAGAHDVERWLAGHALDWLRFETAELELATEDAAREALLCVRVDGLTLGEVGAEVGRRPVRRVRAFGDTSDGLSSLLAGSQPGDVVGPAEIDGSYLVAQLVDRVRPSADDPVIAERARADLLGAAVSRHTAGHVTWHAAL